MGNPNQLLTYVRRNYRWFRLPAKHVFFATASDYQSLSNSIGNDIDTGLIARETMYRKEASQEYWQQVAPREKWDQITICLYRECTTCVSNRHPSDCIHDWIDFVPLEAGESRTLHGKFYFIEGMKDDFLELWKQDFRIVD